MHIEPGVVEGAKMTLAFAAAAGAGVLAGKAAKDDLAGHSARSFSVRCAGAALATLAFFQVFPHFPAGISEVHFIFGTSLYLILGVGPAAVGLAAGLLLQGALFSLGDLSMYAVNVSTLLWPLFFISWVGRRWIVKGRAYVDLRLQDVLILSVLYQAGIVGFVAFWAFYGLGFDAGTMTAVGAFVTSYWYVPPMEALMDMALLTLAKSLKDAAAGDFFHNRLHHPV